MSSIWLRSSQGPIIGWVSAAVLLLCAGCAAPPEVSVAPDACFLADIKEEVYSEILQGKQEILISFELVDGVRPRQSATLNQIAGHWVPAGRRRLQFRVVLPAVGWNDGGGREARGVIDAELQPGQGYKITGHFESGPRTFYLANLISGQPVSEPIDLGFFVPVNRAKQFIPIFIPIRI